MFFRLGVLATYWVHKPGVSHGPASQQKLGPADDVADDVANDAQLMGQPKYLNKQVRRAIQSPTEKPGRGGTTLASDSGPPLQPGMGQTPAHCSSPTGVIRAD